MEKIILIIFIFLFIAPPINADGAKNESIYKCLKSMEAHIGSPHHLWSDRGTMLIYLQSGPDLGISPVKKDGEPNPGILQLESGGRVRFYEIKKKHDGTAQFMIYDGAGSAPMIVNPGVTPAFRQLSVWKKILPTALGGAPDRPTEIVGEGSLKTTAEKLLKETVKEVVVKDIAKKGANGYQFPSDCNAALSEYERTALLRTTGENQDAGKTGTKNAEEPL